MRHNESWEKIFKEYKILEHNFNEKPFLLSNEQIKKACHDFTRTSEKEVRILCKQDQREDRPEIFVKNGLFLLPVKNGQYVIIKGEGYLDLPEIKSDNVDYYSKLDFTLDTSKIGNSEMQHLDFAYASSIIRTFMKDTSLVLTIRGRKYTPQFSFFVNKHKIDVESVQTEVDGGYEGKDQVVLVEAKNTHTTNFIIRQLFYPFRQWHSHTKKKVKLLFFMKSKKNEYYLWLFEFKNPDDYNSIFLADSRKYVMKG